MRRNLNHQLQSHLQSMINGLLVWKSRFVTSGFLDIKKGVQRKPYWWERGFNPNPLTISSSFGIVGIQLVHSSLVRHPTRAFSKFSAAFFHKALTTVRVCMLTLAGAHLTNAEWLDLQHQSRICNKLYRPTRLR
jgi:hypothetical protein